MTHVPGDAAPRVSVIMRTKNCDWVVGQALAALFSQNYREFELLVVDSGSTDRTLEIVRRYPHRLRQIAATDYYPGQVLNDAIGETRGELLVFQNADAVPLHAGVLGQLVAAFDDPEVQAAFTRQLPRPEAATWVRRDYAASFPEAPETPPWITLSLPMAAMRRAAWERHPFYADAWGSEDTEWGLRARANGWTLRYVPGATVMHSHDYTLRQLYGRRFIEGEADAFLHDDAGALATHLLGFGSSVARDLLACLRAGDLADLPRVPLRRAVYHWGHLRGARHGTRRRRSGDRDTSVGQRAVLTRHESER